MALRITKAEDYAMRAMIHLACLPEGRVAMRHEIARAQEIPPSFTAKILRLLVRARLLHSSRGVNGGFGLARPPAEITLLDVIEAIEGPVNVIDCAAEDRCARAAACPAVSTWQRVQSSIHDTLAAANLESLVSMPRRNGRIAAAAERGAGAGLPAVLAD